MSIRCWPYIRFVETLLCFSFPTLLGILAISAHDSRYKDQRVLAYPQQLWLERTVVRKLERICRKECRENGSGIQGLPSISEGETSKARFREVGASLSLLHLKDTITISFQHILPSFQRSPSPSLPSPVRYSVKESNNIPTPAAADTSHNGNVLPSPTPAFPTAGSARLDSRRKSQRHTKTSKDY